MKKLLLIAVIVGVALTGCSSKKTIVTQDGTLEFPYLINTAAQLKALADQVNRGDRTHHGKYYKLTADISLSDYRWMPIGNYMAPFKGHFDGGGHVISDLYIINMPTAVDLPVGLFGHTYEATIQNLGVKGTVSAPNSGFVGGIVGLAAISKIEHCFFHGNVFGCRAVGGIAGELIGGDIKGIISHCWAAGLVSGSGDVENGGVVGGIAGSCAYAKITWCAALNEKIERRDGSSPRFKRIVSYAEDTELSNNMAWSGMGMPDGITISGSHDNEHGLSRNSAQVRNASTFIDHFPSPIWTRADNRLPGLGGRTEAMPAYIN